MGDWPLLSLVTFLPLVGVALIVVLRGDPEVVARNSRSIALWTSLVTFLLSLAVWSNFDPAQPGFQLVEKSPWLAGLGISYYLGVDGISLWFVLLSALLTVVVVIGSWHSVHPAGHVKRVESGRWKIRQRLRVSPSTFHVPLTQKEKPPSFLGGLSLARLSESDQLT